MGYTKLKDDKENEMNTSKATQEEPRPQKEGDEVKEDKNTVESIIGAVGGWSETDREPPNTQKEEEIDQKRSNKGKKDYYDLKKKLKIQGEIVIALRKENEELTGLKEDYEELIGLKEDYVELLNKYMKLKDVKEKEKNTSKATQEEPRPQKEGDEVKEDNITVEPIIGAVGGWSGDQHQNVKEKRKDNLRNEANYTPKRKGITVPKRRLFRMAEEKDDNKNAQKEEEIEQKRSKKGKQRKTKRKEHETSTSEESEKTDSKKDNEHKQDDKLKEVEDRYEKEMKEQNRKLKRELSQNRKIQKTSVVAKEIEIQEHTSNRHEEARGPAGDQKNVKKVSKSVKKE